MTKCKYCNKEFKIIGPHYCRPKKDITKVELKSLPLLDITDAQAEEFKKLQTPGIIEVIDG